MNVDIQNSKTGVSPVIGVVLMVAITVILAAVVGSFALGLVGGQQENPNAAVSFEQDTSAGTMTAQVLTIEQADYLHFDPGNGALVTGSADGTDHDGDGATNDDLDSVGETIKFKNLSSGDQVTVVGNLDGKEAVLQTETFGQ